MEEKPREILNVTPDEEGRVILNLFGKDIEVDESLFDENGHAEFVKFGKIYEVNKPVSKTRRRKAKVVEVEEAIVDESPAEEPDELNEEKK